MAPMAELKAFKSLFRRVSAFGCSLITFTEAAHQPQLFANHCSLEPKVRKTGYSV